MPIPFTCPHCGRQTSVADEYAGQTGPCEACGNPITVPGEPMERKEQLTPAAPLKRAAEPSGLSSGCVAVLAIVVCIVGVLACGGLVAALFMPSISIPRAAVYRTQCNNNLRQIALAMHNYHDTYGSLPPAYVADEDGNPMYSWRVLILPFMEQQALYDQFDLSEPWDSPRNFSISSIALTCYQCPEATVNNPTETNYMVVTGPSTAFPGAEAMSFADVKDGTSNTIMVVEVLGTGVEWAEPVDLDAAQITFPLSNGSATSPGSEHVGGIQAAMCDGSSRFMENTISPQEFNAMLTRSGGEVVTYGY